MLSILRYDTPKPILSTKLINNVLLKFSLIKQKKSIKALTKDTEQAHSNKLILGFLFLLALFPLQTKVGDWRNPEIPKTLDVTKVALLP